MTTTRTGEKRRWIVAAMVAGCMVVATTWLFRVPAPAPAEGGVTSPVGRTAALQIARPGPADELLRQETELRDLRPLFLPTMRNAALPERRREPRQALLEDDNAKPKISETELNLDRALPSVVTLGGRPIEQAEPVDALGLDSELASFAGIGRREVMMAEFKPRGGFVEVTSTRDGSRVFSEVLPIAARPATDKLWAPIVFFAAVEASGLASPLVVTEGSRVEEVDAHFRRYLAQDFRIGLRLTPGLYRVTVAP
ncbi:MAG: hypothetical protein JNK23_18555 [Opitutaceae bacterium]|nr:hypothetical protein [Opitutaceae bacterium]